MMEAQQGVCDDVAASVWGTRGVTRAEVEDACRATLVNICMYVVSSIAVIEEREIERIFALHVELHSLYTSSQAVLYSLTLQPPSNDNQSSTSTLH